MDADLAVGETAVFAAESVCSGPENTPEETQPLQEEIIPGGEVPVLIEVAMMSEFTQTVITRGWLWAALLVLMLLLALDKKWPWPLRSRLEIICATSLAVGLFIVGMLLFTLMTAPSAVAIDPAAFSP